MTDKSPIEIYWFSGSPYAWRVLLALAIKQAPYESRLLSASNEEHRSPEFLAINPKGRVPALRHGELTLRESVAILRYLESCYPEAPLFGSNSAQEAHINQLIDEIENYLVPCSQFITRALFGDIVKGSEVLLNAQAERMHRELIVLESNVGNWLIGDSVSAADVVLYPLIACLLRAAGKPAADKLDLKLLPFDECYPNLSDWCGRIEAMPDFDTTYPPHWRDG